MSELLTCDATFCTGGASIFLGPWKVLASSIEGWVSRLTLLVAGGRGAVGWGGRLVAAIGGVAVARLWAGARAGGADVGYYASWNAMADRKLAMMTGTAATTPHSAEMFLLKQLSTHFFFLLWMTRLDKKCFTSYHEGI